MLAHSPGRVREKLCETDPELAKLDNSLYETYSRPVKRVWERILEAKVSGRTCKWTVLAITLSVAMTLLVVAACSGGGNTSSSTATPKSTAAAGSTSTNTGGATSTAPQQAASTTTGGSALSQLQSLGSNLKQAKGKVTYDSTDTKSDGTVTTSSFTLSSDPPNSRFDTSDASGSSSFIETPSGSYSCSAKTQTCIGFSSTSATGLGLLSSLFTPDVINSYISKLTGVSVAKSSDTIAGVSVTCYSWQNAQTSVATSGKVCFNGDGLMLSLDSTDATGSKTSLKASAVSTTISAADFQPTYPVTTTLP
jgi:hypothetical protein